MAHSLYETYQQGMRSCIHENKYPVQDNEYNYHDHPYEQVSWMELVILASIIPQDAIWYKSYILVWKVLLVIVISISQNHTHEICAYKTSQFNFHQSR